VRDLLFSPSRRSSRKQQQIPRFARNDNSRRTLNSEHAAWDITYAAIYKINSPAAGLDFAKSFHRTNSERVLTHPPKPLS
jgi:type IV secretory pathway component VirB8